MLRSIGFEYRVPRSAPPVIRPAPPRPAVRPAVRRPYDGVVCFALGDWWYHNRGHFDMQLMQRFARCVPVLYVNAMGMRVPAVREGGMFFRRILRKSRSLARGFVQCDARFYVFSPLSVPAYSRPQVRRLNARLVQLQVQRAMQRAGLRRPLAWVVSPPAGDVARHLRCAALIYQRTDDFKEFGGVNRDVVAEMDRQLIAAADLVIHVNRELCADSAARGARTLLTGHGVDYALFAAEPPPAAEPADIAAIPHPRIGYYGGIDSHTFDPQLLCQVAAELPEIQFVLVGACSLPAGTFRAPNIHLLGQKPYAQIPAYGRAFDVAIMPWRQNGWISACNPVKLKEYLALGKPVVSTPYPEGRPFASVVYFALGPLEFASAIRRALREDCPALQAGRRERVAGQTWDALAQQIMARIDEVITERDSRC